MKKNEWREQNFCWSLLAYPLEQNFYWCLLAYPLFFSICIMYETQTNCQSIIFFSDISHKHFSFHMSFKNTFVFIREARFLPITGNVYFSWSISLSSILKIIFIWICHSFSGSDPEREKNSFGLTLVKDFK